MGNEVRHVRITDLDEFSLLFSERGVDPELSSFTASLVRDPDRRTDFAILGGPFDPGRQALSDFVDNMMAPALPTETWLVDLDRRFDWLHSTLLRVRPDPDSESLVTTSVFGATELVVGRADDQHVARGVQGFAQRLSNAETCSAISGFLNELAPQAVHQAADLSAMVAEGRYKAHSNQDPDDVRSTVAEDFVGLRDFYDAVATAGASVLVVRD